MISVLYIIGWYLSISNANIVISIINFLKEIQNNYEKCYILYMAGGKGNAAENHVEFGSD